MCRNRFMFGIKVFGADDRTFPFLAKYRCLGEACRHLVLTLTTDIEYRDEPPLLEALDGTDT